MTYVKHNKWTVFSIAIVIGGIFFAFKNNRANADEPIELRHRKLLSTIGRLLESEHYSPRKIDDAFSNDVFEGYIKALDGDKSIFTQEDINKLNGFRKTIDDEIHGDDIKFVPSIDSIYERRFAESKQIFNQIIAKPFQFIAMDTVNFDYDKVAFPADLNAKQQRWYLLTKYRILERFTSLLEDREKNKGKEKFEVKSDSVLETEARASVKKAQLKKFEAQEKTFGKEKRFDLFLNSITNLMDPHTDYLAPIEKRSFTEQMSGVFYGIGALLGQDDRGVKITNITPGGSAWKSGQLAVNDVIIKIAQGADEPVDIEGYETTEAVKLIRGNLGTEVRLTIRKPDGTIKVVALRREKVVLDEGYARSAVFEKNGVKYGYIWLPDFYADFEREDGHRCSEDVAKEVEKLKAEHVKGITIDVRYNGGGSLYEVVQMMGLFIDKGPVVQIRTKDGKAQVLSDERPGILYDGPLVVMVNEFSASASEIFAAAVQDYHRGLIVGSSSTYGKGTVQRNISFGRPLDSLGIQTEYGSVKLTFQKFYRVTGSSTQLKGVASDIVLPDEFEYFKYREKDNESALPWDEMQRVKYQTWPSTTNLASIAAAANKKIASDSNNMKLKKNFQWIASQSEKTMSLQLDSFIAYKKKVVDIGKQNESILKLKDSMHIQPLKADYDKFYNNPDKPKQDRYQAWLKQVSKDKQISDCLNLIDQFVSPALNEKNSSFKK